MRFYNRPLQYIFVYSGGDLIINPPDSLIIQPGAPFIVDGHSMGRGILGYGADPNNQGPYTGVGFQDVVVTDSPCFFAAGRAFVVVATVVIGNQSFVDFNIYNTYVFADGGQEIIGPTISIPAGAFATFGMNRVFVNNSGSDISSWLHYSIALTNDPVIILAQHEYPTEIWVYDVGDASDFPNAPSL